ncbi:PKD domain-containing protein [Tellurirhabdus bombi]|uniref:PKD domain-containing protein n=1 Tax=Tellurirhabdus bombi TaxID=2907205 RepID=UPI001F41E579|nr:PKD domain-containing protein [Tellurirhabdus bombi]
MKQIRWLIVLCLGLVFNLAQAQVPTQSGIVVSGRLCAPDPTCKTDSTAFSDTLKTATAWSWDFGDASSGEANTSTKANPKHLYLQPGQYTVTLTRTVNGVQEAPVTKIISIDVPPPPFPQWRTDTMICQGQTIELDPYPGGQGAPAGAKYLWYPKGDTTRALSIDSSGCYSVQVIMPNGCTYEDRINVKVCGERPQQQGAKWFFGGNAGLDFSGGGSPKPIDDSSINTAEGTSSISNSKGQLLFYTDGVTIYDKDGGVMKPVNPADTAKLGGNANSTQSALIVPQPTCRGCEYLYHVYTTSEINGSKVLTYTVVDMRLNQGKGGIVNKNIPLAGSAESTERLASVRNDRDTTYWVISRDFGNNTFNVYHMTPAGLSDPVKYQLGETQDTPTQGEGYLKIGPADTSGTGDRPMAMIVPGPPRNYVELYTFNDSTGVLTAGPRVDLGPAPPTAYGVEFSPNGQKMYVSFQGNDSTAAQIVIYDISSDDATVIADTRSVLDSTSNRQYGALQIGSDGRIYVAVEGSKALGVIENPNDDLLAGATFDPNGADLGGKTSQLGLPSFVANFNEPSNSPAFSYADTCAGEPTNFQTSPNCDPLKDRYTWTYGDGSPPFSTTATTAHHTYQNPGAYQASLHIVTLRSDGSVCKDTTITQTINIVRKPDEIDLGPDIDSCRNSVTLDAKIEADNYIWIRNGRILRFETGRRLTLRFPTGALTSTNNPSGTYIVIAHNGGCFQVDTINVTLRQPPRFSLGPDTTYCEGSSVQLVAPGASWSEYKWSTGAGSREITVSQPGVYSVVVRNPQGCENADTIRVTSNPRPIVTATLTAPSGCTIADGSIRLNVSRAQARRFDWTREDGSSVGDTTALLQNVPDGLYKVRITSTNACVTDTSFRLTSANSIDVSLEGLTAKCSVPLSGGVRVTINRGRPTQFVWRDRNGNEVGTSSALSQVNAGLYFYEARDNGGCVFRDSVLVPVDTTGFVNLGPDRGKCEGDTIRLQSLVPVTQGDTYQWSNGQNSSSITVNSNGTYRLTVRNDLTGCRGSDEIEVSFNPKPTVEAGPPLIICTNQQPVRIADATPVNGAWSGRGVNAIGVFTPADSLIGTNPNAPLVLTYTVTVRGCANTDTKAVFLQRPPVVELGPDTTLCPTPSFRLQASSSSAATFQWSTGETTASIRPTTSGTYSVTAIVGACQARDDLRITFRPLPTYELTKEVPLCVGDRGTAIVRVNSRSPLTYLWPHSQETTPTVTVDRIGTYVVQITNEAGCTAEDTALVVDKCEPRVQIPDAFTPNADGANDFLDIFTAYTTDFELKIFNRWGEVIFMSQQPELKWDGTYKGTPYPAMVYPYTITYKSQYYPERPKMTKRGSILLIR